jgi:8-oxo-dGTP pyrophosphatase MutT (NUDIX family)
MEARVLQAATREAREEVGLEIGKDTEIFCKKICGATMEWDLWYVVVKSHSDHKDGTDFGS